MKINIFTSTLSEYFTTKAQIILKLPTHTICGVLWQFRSTAQINTLTQTQP
jgi:hypothetical protein